MKDFEIITKEETRVETLPKIKDGVAERDEEGNEVFETIETTEQKKYIRRYFDVPYEDEMLSLQKEKEEHERALAEKDEKLESLVQEELKTRLQVIKK